MFEMLSGRLPFIAESHTAIALKHLHEAPPKVTRFNTAVPEQISQIIDKILAKEPTGRYRTAGQLGRILSTYRQRTLIDTGPQTRSSEPLPPDPTATVPVHEQQTQIYERPDSQPTDSQAADDQAGSSLSDTTKPNLPIQMPPEHNPVRTSIRGNSTETAVEPLTQPLINEPDWTAITLGIAALVALLGLMPLWIMVYLAWT